MEKLLADTHAIIWYSEDNPKLGTNAKRLLDLTLEAKAYLYLSMMSLFEMDYLIRKNKIDKRLPELLIKKSKESRSVFKIVDIDFKVYQSFLKIDPKLIPELPDRVIAATALVHSCTLLTKDSKIIGSKLLNTIW